jgi:hypothetical protein
VAPEDVRRGAVNVMNCETSEEKIKIIRVNLYKRTMQANSYRSKAKAK